VLLLEELQPAASMPFKVELSTVDGLLDVTVVKADNLARTIDS
jgi:hypothetical protein